MKFFSRNTTLKRLNGPLPIDRETGLYSRNFFLLRLKEERERSKRTGSPFSLLIVDIVGISAALNGKTRTPTDRAQQKKLIQAILRQSRKIDIKGWIDLKRIGIIMPDTKNSGALECKEKICRQIRHDRSAGEKINLEEFTRVFTFDESSANGNGSMLNQGNGEGGSISPEDNAVFMDILRESTFFSVKSL